MFPVHEAHQVKQSMCVAKLCSEEWSRLCRPPVLKLPLTELSHICTTSDTALLQPHPTRFLTIVHSVTGTVPPPPNRGSFPFTKAHCHGCRFLLLISGVMSICTALPEMCCCLCSTGRELSLPSPMTSAASHCTFFRDYLFSCSLCSLQSVSNMSQSKNTCGASPRHISNFSSFHFL